MVPELDDFAQYLAERGVSEERRRAQLRVLERFLRDGKRDARSSVEPAALELHLQHRHEVGCAPTTLRTERQMIVSFYEWAYRRRLISAETLLGFRGVRSPARCSSRGRPRPYGRRDLKTLWQTLEERWPRLPADEAERLARRWVEGKTPYSRIRRHAIRLQLEAIIALALACGLRRHEILAVAIEDIHPDNAHALVWAGQERWIDMGNVRPVPYTRRAREALRDWLTFHELLQPDHDYPWLSLWRENTARDRLNPETFEKLLSIYVGPGWTLKRLRDTCAVNWTQAGLHAGYLRQLLGLCSVKDALPYLEAATGDLDQRIARLDQRFTERSSQPEHAA